jgi:hypothetical protein
MKNYTWFILLLSLGVNSAFSANIKDVENKIGTNGNTDRKFHTLASAASSCDKIFCFDGFLVGIEKTKRKIVLHNKKTPNVFMNSLKVLTVPSSKSEILKSSVSQRLYNDSEVPFVSHIIDTDTYSQNKYIYNLYEDIANNSSLDISEDKIYQYGWDALDKLRIKIIERVKKAERDNNKYTHLILMSTGWNTTQVESVEAYNNWSNVITKKAPNNLKFRPLFITLSWPSVWLHREESVPLSVKRKGNDADEIGLLIANMLVNHVMLDKNLKGLKKVLIGHSFGARLLSRALFSKGLIKSTNDLEGEIDTFIGLQAAFSIKRFSPEKAETPWYKSNNGEGFPYRRWSNMKTKLFFTMSEHDEAGGVKANLIAKVFPRDKHIMLGKSSWNKAKKLSSGKVDIEDRINNIKFITIKDLNCNSFLKPIVSQPQGGDIIYVNSSKCIADHNDVYELRHGSLINKFISY